MVAMDYHGFSPVPFRTEASFRKFWSSIVTQMRFPEKKHTLKINICIQALLISAYIHLDTLFWLTQHKMTVTTSLGWTLLYNQRYFLSQASFAPQLWNKGQRSHFLHTHPPLDKLPHRRQHYSSNARLATSIQGPLWQKYSSS